MATVPPAGMLAGAVYVVVCVTPSVCEGLKVPHAPLVLVPQAAVQSTPRRLVSVEVAVNVAVEQTAIVVESVDGLLTAINVLERTVAVAVL